MPNITVTEAQELVTRFKSAVEEHELATNAAVETEATLREVVYEIHKREAWKALNYKDFKSFINKVLPITKSQAYRLIEERETELSIGKVEGVAPMTGRVLSQLGKIESVEERKNVVNEAKSKSKGDGDVVITPKQVTVKKPSSKPVDGVPRGTRKKPDTEPETPVESADTPIEIANLVLLALRKCSEKIQVLQREHRMHEWFPQQILVDIASAGLAVKEGIEKIK